MNFRELFQIIDVYKINYFPLNPKSKDPRGLIKWKIYQKEKFPFALRHKYFTLQKDYNIAIICGQISNNLYIVDVDEKEFADLVEQMIPQTLTVQTSHGKHFYFFDKTTKDIDRYEFREHEENEKELFGVDIRGEGSYAVGPGSIHPSGLEYKLLKNVPIPNYPCTEVINVLYKLGERLQLHVKKVIGSTTPKKAKTQSKVFDRNKIDTEIQELEDILPDLSSMIGFEGLGPHPIHGSETGKNLDVTGNQWYCFRHQCGGGKFQWYALQEGIADCSEGRNKQLKLSTQQWKEVFQSIKKEYNLVENELVAFLPVDESLAPKEKISQKIIDRKKRNLERLRTQGDVYDDKRARSN